MNPAFIIPVRNKERWVARSLKSVLAQTIPMTVIVSDQGSTDRSRDVVQSIASTYDGPHNLILTNCPDRTAYGMAGVNAHLRWLVGEFDHDVFLINTADDTVEPECAAMILGAMEKTGASSCGSHVLFMDPLKGGQVQITPYPKESRFVTAAEHFNERVGGSSFRAFTRELFEFAAPMADSISDVWLPYWATCMGGYYVVTEKTLGTYWTHADAGNTGLEGVRRAAKTPLDVERINEKIWLEILRTCSRALKLGAEKAATGWTWKPESKEALMQTILQLGVGYVGCADQIKRLEAAEAKAA